MVPGADVHARPDGGVADVRQVRRLGAVAEVRLLELDEVAHLGLGADAALRADVREGPDRGRRAHHALAAAGSGRGSGRRGRSRHPPGARRGRRSPPGGPRCGPRGTCRGGSPRPPPPPRRGRCGWWPGSSIDAPAAISASARRRRSRRVVSASSATVLTPSASPGSPALTAPTVLPAARSRPDHVGQVVLALRVLRLQLPQDLQQRGHLEGVEAGVDLAHPGLVGGRVLGLHDGAHAARLVAQHPPVRAGIVEVDGEQGGRGAARGGARPAARPASPAAAAAGRR